MTEIVATMKFKKETKGTVVYEEMEDSPAGGAIGTQYINKYAAKNVLGDGTHPQEIELTVKAL
jgi:hypothetical protein